LYIQVFQEEHAIIKKIIPQDLLQEYQKWFNLLAHSKYMNNVDVQKMRAKFDFEDYGLHMYDFIKS
jgi:hypothetical protein